MMSVEEKIQKFKELVLFYNEKINLTSITDSHEFDVKHIEDSLLPLKVIDFSSKKVMDIGSGAGFPGIPLAIYNPSSTFYLVEPTLKRCNFLNTVKEELGLENVIIVNQRAEDLDKKEFSNFDFVVSRAVSDLRILLELSIPYLKVGGKLIAYKGDKAEEEIKTSQNCLKVLSSHVESIQKETLSIKELIRNNIIIVKDKETNPKYPRRYNEIKKRPL